MSLFAKKEPSPYLNILVVVIMGFGLLLFMALVAYQVESRSLFASQTRIISQQGRINELEKLLKQKDEEIKVLLEERARRTQ